MSPTHRRAARPDVDSHGSDRDRDDLAGVTGLTVSGPVVGFDPEELVGFRIGVTAHRRSADLIAALERRGAEVLHAPTLQIVPADRDERLVAATAEVIKARPDVLLVTTAYGLNGWLEAADAAGLGQNLLEVLAQARILVRGPKARGAVRAGGLRDSGMSDEETTASLVDQVLAQDAAGRTVAVQLHGFVDDEQLARLRAAGATVITVAPYLWTAPSEPHRVVRLLDAIVARTLDAVTFTSAPAAEALLVAARERGLLEPVVAAMRADVVPFAVGPVTAAPLHAVGVIAIHPDRYRLGALVRTLCEYLLEHQVRRIPTRHGLLEIRGRSAALGPHRVILSPTSIAVLRVLADADGAVVPKARLQEVLADSDDDHALEVAIARLRQALPQRELVGTVIKRGYRLDV